VAAAIAHGRIAKPRGSTVTRLFQVKPAGRERRACICKNFYTFHIEQGRGVGTQGDARFYLLFCFFLFPHFS